MQTAKDSQAGRQHLLRCSRWESGQQRCQNQATVTLVAPNGKVIPHGYFCRPCAENAVAEYAEKLGEHWSVGSFA